MSYVSTLRINLQKPSKAHATAPSQGTKDGLTAVTTNGAQEPQQQRPELPAFSRPLRDCSVQEGSDFTLEGHVTGTPPISVSWQHNGEPLRFRKSSFHDGVARLVVDGCLPEDAGVYTCMLANCAGKTSSTAAVMVKDMCKFPKSKDSHVSRVMVSSKVTSVSSLPKVSSRVTSVSSSSMVSRVTVAPNSTPELEKGAMTLLFEVLPQHGITREVCLKGPRVSGTASHIYVADREKTSNSQTSRMTPPATLHATVAVNAQATSNYNDVSDNRVSTTSPAVGSSHPTQGIGKTFKTTRTEITMVANNRPMEKAERVLSQLTEKRPKDYSTAGDSEKEAPGNLVSSAKLISVARKEGTSTASNINTKPIRPHKVTVKENETTSSPASGQSPERPKTGLSEINGGVSRSTHGRAKKQCVLLLETTAAPKNGLQEIATRLPTSLDYIHLQNGNHALVTKKDGPAQNTFTKATRSESTGNAFVSKKTTAGTVYAKKATEHAPTVPAEVHSPDNTDGGISKSDVSKYRPSTSNASPSLATERESKVNTTTTKIAPPGTDCRMRAVERTPTMPEEVHSPEHSSEGVSEDDSSMYRPSPVRASTSPGRAKKQRVHLLGTTAAPKNGLQEIATRIPASLDYILLQNGNHALLSKKDGPSQNTFTKATCSESTGNAFVSKKTTAGTVYVKKAKDHDPTVPAEVHSPEDTDGGIAKSDVSMYRPSTSNASTTLATERESTVNATTTKISLPGTDCRTRAAERTPTMPEEVHSPEHSSEGVSEDNSSMYLPSPVSASTSPDSVTPKRRALKSGDSLKLVDPVTSVEVRAGDQAELHCEILGSPPIAASWVKQKKQISGGPKTSVETTDTGSTLVIREVQADDSGCYTLYVRNRTGSIQHQISLSVTDRPQPPVGKPYASALLADSLTLSWSGPCYDGGSAIQSYVVEVKGVGEVKWRTLTDSCLSTSYRVKGGLLPDQEYQFRVRAVNSHGASDPGEESAVIKMSLEEDASGTETFEYQQVIINTTEKVSDLYIQLERLGVGKFGQVYRLQEKATGKILAGKFYKTRLAKERESARMEVELMNKLHHPKLAQCVAAYQTRTEMVMVLEYIAGGELFERIVDDAFEHTEPTCVQYMRQILEGVQYMHSQNIVHLDLKPENIVCVNRTGNYIKIIDFGLARMLLHGTQVKVMQGTPEFIAPEVIAFEPIDFTTDMWSIGVVCYILLSGDSPFQGNNDMETLRNVTAAQWEFDEETFEEISDRAKDFINNLLKKSMRSRLTADKALHHPWLQETEQGNTKTLSKEKIKKFLARQKWLKTGKAVLALTRMTLLSNKQDNKVTSPDSPQQDVLGLSPEDNEVFSFLHQQIQQPPSFSKPLKDQAEVEGSSACLQCHIEGYPDPEVIWFQNGIPIQDCGRYRIEYDETANCSLIISEVTQGDSGLYSCKAFNDMGEAEISAKLTVYALHGARNS